MAVVYSVGAPALMYFALHLLAVLAADFKEKQEAEGGKLPISFFNVSKGIAPWVSWVLEIALIVTVFFSAIAYLIVAGQLVASMMLDAKPAEGSPTLKSWESSEWFIGAMTKIIIVAVLGVPCFFRNLSGMTIPNTIALVCLAFVVSIAVIKFDSTKLSKSEYDEIYTPKSFANTIKGISTFLFAFCCTPNLFSVANDMKNFTVRRLNTASGSAIVTGIVLNSIAGFLPFMTFGRKSEDIFLNNFQQSGDILILAARIACTYQVALTYLLVIHPLRDSVIGLIYRNGLPTGKEEVKIRYLVTGISILVTFGLSLLIKLDIVFSFAGLFGANTLCFLVPCLLYCIRYPRSERPITWVLSAVLLLFSLALFPLGVYGIIKSVK